jgi:hypothetical protein
LRVLFVTTEMDDFVRVGGLAAVSAALPRALRLWSDVRIILPGYRDIVEQFTHIQIVGECAALADMPACSLGLASTKDGLPVYVLLRHPAGVHDVRGEGSSQLHAAECDVAIIQLGHFRRLLRRTISQGFVPLGAQSTAAGMFVALRRVSGITNQIMARPIAATPASPVKATLLPNLSLT